MPIIFPIDKISIESWKAYKGKYPPGSEKEHRIIIICKKENVLKYFYVSSQVDKARARAVYDKTSFVFMKKNDWDELDRESYVQCTPKHLKEVNEDEFKKSYLSGDVKILGEVPEGIKRAIIHAICSSRFFSEKEKKEYTE